MYDIEDKWIVGVGAIFVIGLITLLVLGIKAGVAEDNRLIAQCMADGKKEYECKAMFKRNETTVVPMPVIINR